MAKFAITVSSLSLIIFVWTTFGLGLLKGKRKAEAELTDRKFQPFSPTHFQFRFYPAQLLKSHMTTNIKPLDLHRSSCKPNKMAMLYLCLLVMLQAGDCQPNPGPISPVASNRSTNSSNSETKFPCNICKAACLWGERAICCDSCNEWYHVKCMSMNTVCYETLAQHSSLSWICCSCGLPNFASSLFTADSNPVNMSNSFSSLNTEESGSSDQCIRSPLATSSPQKEKEKVKLKAGKPQNNRGNPKFKNVKASSNKQMKILVINFQSIRGKTAELHTCLQTDNPDLIIGNETWLDDSVESSEIFPSSYRVFRKDRKPNAKGKAYGGVLIAVRSEITCIPRIDLDTTNESVWIEISVNGMKPILVGSFYRPPNTNREYLNSLRDSLEKTNGNQFSNVWVGGDFNLGDIVWESQSIRTGGQKTTMCQDLIDISNDYGLEQVVVKPTRGENTLDLFFVKNPSLVTKSDIIPGISDHDGIPMIQMNTKPSSTKQKPRKVYFYGKTDVMGLRNDMANISENFKDKDLNSTNANDLWLELKTKLFSAVNTHIPSKTVSKRNETPWINSSIKRTYKRKQRAYNKAKKSKKQEDWEKFKEIRRENKKETRKAYRKYVNERCTDSAKKFWNFIKTLRKDSSGIPALRDMDTGTLVTDSKQKAELLNRQYQQQFTQERLFDLPQEDETNIPSMPEIEVTVEGVVKLLKDLSPHKAAGPDEISPWVLRTAAEEIGPALTIIFQLSLETGIVPEDWLCANITPVFKKGDKTQPANYRSVNLASVCSKVMEHVICSNMMSHLDTHNILCNQQHGFRKKHSCETQLLSTVHDISHELDQKRQVDVIIMDFQKAFDKVPHRRLLIKLWRYGIRGKAHKWIEQFLTKRKQRVVVEGEHSEWVNVDSSVPQGTVTGPIDFLLFINDLPDGLESSCRLFADDCILYTTVKGPQDADRLQRDLDRLTSWQDKWQMDFNAQKCFVLRISHAKKPFNFEYTLNNTKLEETKTHTYLGVDLSSDLKWNSQVEKICSKANRTLGFLRRNLYDCPAHIKEMAYKTLVRPTLDYCSSVWDPHTQTLTNKIEMIQNRAVRFITGD